MSGTLGKEFLYDRSHGFNLTLGHFRIHGERHHFRTDPFGNGILTGLISQISVRTLQVEWNRIVNPGADTPGLEMLDERSPLGRPNHEQVVHVLDKRPARRQ